jgi:hypothetical protein
METFQEVWNAYDEEIVFKVSEWHHITRTASDGKGDCSKRWNLGILVLYYYTILSKHMKMLCISPHIAPSLITLEWCNNHRRASYMLEVS